MNIDVPKPAAKPNKSRPINTLLQCQIKRLWEVEQLQVPAHRTGISINPEKLHELTEGQAAEYIRRMTAKLHDLGPASRAKRRSQPKPQTAVESVEDMLRVLKKRGVSQTCSRCANNDWNAEFLGYWASPLEPNGPTTVGPYIPVLSLTCKNCGAVHLHNLKELGVQM